ncbi:MAG: DUF2784 domain-containing protein [Kangiellaceae bacterium]|nr:DUF2784 domain-containing protein [Kangiellaceae bacterium]MCW9000848.1 DUF2784 domain-containing protein [Kangiellaceae bacterium]
MSEQQLLLLAADFVLIVHVAFVAFVILGLIFIYLGLFLKWRWVKNFRFRIAHLAAITVVVLESWIGMICPLTTWEMALRESAGDATYSGSFIQHWLQSLLYYSAPEWVFIVCYTVFGSLVLASWFVVRPARKSKEN